MRELKVREIVISLITIGLSKCFRVDVIPIIPDIFEYEVKRQCNEEMPEFINRMHEKYGR